MNQGSQAKSIANSGEKMKENKVLSASTDEPVKPTEAH